jgi:erythromycin esterase
MRRDFTNDAGVEDLAVVQNIKQKAHTLYSKVDLQPLFDRIDEASIVMLGEASYGTHEYYTWRAHITTRLIEEKGFNFIAVEGDWHDCYKLNRFVKGYDSTYKSAYKALSTFNHWPTWMWANWEMVALAFWLKEHNSNLPVDNKIGFYGLDVFSLWESRNNILDFLKKYDSSAYKSAKEAFHCFEPYIKQGAVNGQASQIVPDQFENEVVYLLKKIQQQMPGYHLDYEGQFQEEQKALMSANADRYYRSMIKGGPDSWNMRDRHMADIMGKLLNFHGPDSKVIIWQHNAHIGDARATEMADEGMFNLGELARLQYKNKGVVLVGFGSNKGTVMASKRCGAKMQIMQMPEAVKGSWENLLHQAGKQNKLLLMDDFSNNDMLMENFIPHRAIGLEYHPAYEQFANYIPCILPMAYDAFIYLDQTVALYPLHNDQQGAQIPETYPFGM